MDAGISPSDHVRNKISQCQTLHCDASKRVFVSAERELQTVDTSTPFSNSLDNNVPINCKHVLLPLGHSILIT